VLLPHQSSFYHPDLVHASDAVVGKLGYSTLAEVYHSGVPFGYVARTHFPESQPLAHYVKRNMPGVVIEEGDFTSGHWLCQFPELLSLKPIRRRGPNGAKEIASYIGGLLRPRDRKKKESQVRKA
jgi:UDP-N-acetylglucosamine:LPS N-acetylglucosamine transferase